MLGLGSVVNPLTRRIAPHDNRPIADVEEKLNARCTRDCVRCLTSYADAAGFIGRAVKWRFTTAGATGKGFSETPRPVR